MIWSEIQSRSNRILFFIRDVLSMIFYKSMSAYFNPAISQFYKNLNFGKIIVESAEMVWSEYDSV